MDEQWPPPPKREISNTDATRRRHYAGTPALVASTTGFILNVVGWCLCDVQVPISIRQAHAAISIMLGLSAVGLVVGIYGFIGGFRNIRSIQGKIAIVIALPVILYDAFLIHSFIEFAQHPITPL